MEFFAHCFDLQIFKEGIVDQFSVVSDGVLGKRICTTPLQYSLMSIRKPVYCL